MPLATIPTHMQQAVLAIEDQGFYSHPGINPVPDDRALSSPTSSATTRTCVGYSTITQQLARMFFLADEFNAELQTRRARRHRARKVREMIMSLVLERRASKDEILELYLNDVYLGQRGSFAIHGVAEASRLFFGKDVANLSLSEAALIAGVIQSPASRSPFANPKRAIERRNVVLRAMADEEFITDRRGRARDRASRCRSSRAPWTTRRRTSSTWSASRSASDVPRRHRADPDASTSTPRSTSTCSAPRSTPCATASRNVDKLLAGDAEAPQRRRPRSSPSIRAPARFSRWSAAARTTSRSTTAPSSRGASRARCSSRSSSSPRSSGPPRKGATDLTPASLTLDEPATFTFDDQVWEPRNYDDYDGEITWRRALAMSRNLGTIHVGEAVGFDRSRRSGGRSASARRRGRIPSITLGVFELTPLEVAQAYTLFTNGGRVRPLARHRPHRDRASEDLRPKRAEAASASHVPTPRTSSRNMMRSVINEGTGASARGNGFTLDAAGKSGTTNDLRDAWFVGFTPELLTVVWVGFDDNQPVGLSGTQAALPIWTEFMKTALAGHTSLPFEAPDGITFAEIDRDTGKLALPGCPRVLQRIVPHRDRTARRSASCTAGKDSRYRGRCNRTDAAGAISRAVGAISFTRSVPASVLSVQLRRRCNSALPPQNRAPT